MCTNKFGREVYTEKKSFNTHDRVRARSSNNGRIRDYSGKQAKYEFAT